MTQTSFSTSSYPAHQHDATTSGLQNVEIDAASSSDAAQQQADPSRAVQQHGGKSPRFAMWIAFLVFATITMGSAVGLTRSTTNYNESHANYAIGASATTFAISALVVLAHFFTAASSACIGTWMEGLTILVLAVLWGFIVALTTNEITGNGGGGLSVNSNNQVNTVRNGNLYYSSWAGFITSILLLVNYLRHIMGVDVVATFRNNRASRLSLWAGMLATSLVVMGACSSIMVTSDYCDYASMQVLCRRTKFGVSVGTIGLVASMVILALKMCASTSAPLLIEAATALVLTVLNAFGVAFLTSPGGPGSAIGNLYYFSWGSFLCAAFLCADAYNQSSANNAAATGASDEQQQETYATKDVAMQDTELGHVDIQL